MEYLSNFIKIAVNRKVRTLETRIIPNKKAPEGADFKNGASNGLNFEPGVNYIVKFTHLCLHDEETIEQIKTCLICDTITSEGL